MTCFDSHSHCIDLIMYLVTLINDQGREQIIEVFAVSAFDAVRFAERQTQQRAIRVSEPN